MQKKRNRYKIMEQRISIALIVDLIFFVVFLTLSGKGILWGKITFSLLCIFLSAAILGFLYLTKELLKMRSIWMSLASASIIICTLFSLLLYFPRPKPVYHPINETQSVVIDTNPADDDYNKDGYVDPDSSRP